MASSSPLLFDLRFNYSSQYYKDSGTYDRMRVEIQIRDIIRLAAECASAQLGSVVEIPRFESDLASDRCILKGYPSGLTDAIPLIAFSEALNRALALILERSEKVPFSGISTRGDGKKIASFDHGEEYELPSSPLLFTDTQEATFKRTFNSLVNYTQSGSLSFHREESGLVTPILLVVDHPAS